MEVHLVLLLVNLVVALVEVDIDPEDLATRCLLELADVNFIADNVVTVVWSHSSGAGVVDGVLRGLESRFKWAVEVNNGSKNSFDSLKKCAGRRCWYQFQPNYRQEYYVIFLDRREQLDGVLDSLRKLRTYRIKAMFLLYYSGLQSNYRELAGELLMVARSYKLYEVYLLIPRYQDTLYLYWLPLFQPPQRDCDDNMELVLYGRCIRGQVNEVVLKRQSDIIRNCTLWANAMRLPPLVISPSGGIEIEIVQKLQERLNVRFNITLIKKTRDWGKKVKGVWKGPLRHIYGSSFILAVGGAYLSEERVRDFDFSHSYFTERLSWVAPSAEFVPKWKVLVVIFSLHLWLVLVTCLFLCGFLLYLFGLLGRHEYNYLKSPSAGVTMSLQVTLGNAVYTQPRSQPVRVAFICMCMSALITSCYYQTCLIDVLSKPRYEKQVDTKEEVYASKLGVGGLSSYRALFNETPIFNTFKTDTANDNMLHWIRQVSHHKSISLLSSIYVDHLIASKDPLVTYHDSTSKIYKVPFVVVTYPIRILFSRSFPLKEPINNVVSALVEYGFLLKWQNKYMQEDDTSADDTDESDEEGPSNSGPQTLAVEDLQSVFSLLLLGSAGATAAFCLEFATVLLPALVEKFWKRKPQSGLKFTGNMITVDGRNIIVVTGSNLYPDDDYD